MNSIKNFFKVFLSLLVIALILSLFIEIQAVAPDNVRLLIDHKYNTYSAPACLNPNINYDTPEFSISTFGNARKLNYESDSACTNNEIFPSRSVFSHYVLEKIGILKPLKKWNEDGTWNL